MGWQNLPGTMLAFRRVIAAFREADWLSAQRAHAWCVVLVLATSAMAVVWVGLSHDGVDLWGKPLGTDFLSFWTASRFALDGQPTLAYDMLAHAAAQRALFPAAEPGYYAFFYPPVFLLICLPLAMAPYLAALVLWLAAGFVALLACVRRLLPQRWAILPVFAFPGVLLNVEHGQNAFLSAGCFGGFMLLLQRRPFVAGLCLGGLVFKPHLLLAAPVALLAGRRWAAIAGGVTSGLGLGLASLYCFGAGTWLAFLDAAPLARETLEQDLVGPAKMQSMFAAIRVLHGSVTVAYAAQVMVAVFAATLLGAAAGRRPGASAEGALLIVATLLCTPFLLDYDLVCMALPIAWVMAEALRTGWLPWEKSALFAAYVLPLVSRPLAISLGLPIAPMVILALLLAVGRRASALAGRRVAGSSFA